MDAARPGVSPRETRHRQHGGMALELEPCTESEFNAAIISHAARPGWRVHSDHRRRRWRGYVGGALVVEYRVIGRQEFFFRRAGVAVPAFRYAAGAGACGCGVRSGAGHVGGDPRPWGA